jgi:homoserine kinase
MIRDTMIEAGALTAMISGSGPTVFAITADDGSKKQVADSLRKVFCGDSNLKIFTI